jgi:hypothetical protein
MTRSIQGLKQSDNDSEAFVLCLRRGREFDRSRLPAGAVAEPAIIGSRHQQKSRPQAAFLSG